MASFITAGNATNGLQVSSDNTGILELRTGTGSGTTAVTIGATQNATFAGSVGVGTSSPAVTFHAANTGGGGMSGANPSGEVSRLQQTPSAGSGGYVVQRLFLNKTSTANDGVSLSFEGLAAGGDRYALANIGGYISSAGTGNAVSGHFAIFTKPANGDITERARITSVGEFLVGKTTTADGTIGGVMQPGGRIAGTMAASTNSNDTLTVYSTGAAAYRFYVGLGGTIFATSTTISAISDIRLKENIQDLDVGLDKIMALKPRKFDWKEGKGKNIKGDMGWIAQEFEEVFPDMIGTWKDEPPEGEEPYKSVGADLIPVLVKAMQQQQAMIQELNAKVEAQAAEIAALKGNA